MKLVQINLFITLAIISCGGHPYSDTNNWANMVNQYQILCANLNTKYATVNDKTWCSDYWNSQTQILKHIILREPGEGIWKKNFIHQNMIRGGINISQQYEICYINSCLSKQTKDLIVAYKDVQLPGIPIECSEFQCSTNTLGHLFYTAKILEKAAAHKISLRNIVEFGAGYGNLARILKSVLPTSTIILIDLPEFIALQYYFLKETLPVDTKIILHATIPLNFDDNAIHLVPVFFMDNINLQADLFVSTFALSEAPLSIQEKIKQKKLFDASLVYITGQLDGGTEVKMENHNFIHETIRNFYYHVDCQPFHNLFQALKSYEIFGTAPKRATS